MNYSNYRSSEPLTNEQLQRVAPSVFATRPYAKMTDKYSFIPTIQVVDEMRNNGFQPFSVVQSRTRIEGKSDFTKHLIRFRDANNVKPLADSELGDIFPELVLVNSHDGTSSYQLIAGLFRLVCKNGMMVSDAQLESLRVKHIGNVSDVIDASFEVVEKFPEVIEQVREFQHLQLTDGQQKAYARGALDLRYADKDGKTNSPIRPEELLVARRYEDSKNTLWNMFNRVQENLIKGGIRGFNANNRRTTTRAITSISEDVRLNKALWTYTTEVLKAETSKEMNPSVPVSI